MTERTLERLWDLEEIRDLARRYAFAVDSRNFALLGSLFVDAPEPPAPPGVNSHISRRMPEFFAKGGASTLFVGNHTVEFDGPDQAHGSVYCLAFVERESFVDQAIIYQDQYLRQDGRWLFRHRDHLLWWGQERAENPMAQPAANWPASQIGAGEAHMLIRFSG